MSVILSDEELSLLRLADQEGEIPSPDLIQLLWLEQSPLVFDEDVHCIQLDDVHQLTSQLQHANELDALVVAASRLSPSEQSTLASLLEEQSHLSVFVVGELPDMDFGLSDFYYVEDQQSLKLQLQAWLNELKQQFNYWVSSRRILQYGCDFSLALAEQGFTQVNTVLQDQTLWIQQLCKARLVIVNVTASDSSLLSFLQSLAHSAVRHPIVLCYERHDVLLALVKRLVKRLNIPLFALIPTDKFCEHQAFIVPRSFRLYRHRLRQQALYHGQQHLIISDCFSQQKIGYWNWGQHRPAQQTIYAQYWPLASESELTLQAQSMEQCYLIFAPHFPIDELGQLIELKQQGYRFAWEVQSTSELDNRLDLVELLDLLVLPLDLWQQIGVNEDSKRYWKLMRSQCDRLMVPIAILGGQAELSPFWRDKGFSWVIHKEQPDLA